MGDLHPNGYQAFGWSPDGRTIIEIPGNLPDETQDENPIFLIDVTTGKQTDTGWMAASADTWQRRAP